MKKSILTEVCVVLMLLLFAYTATSKFLDYDKFVFQMLLAPVPLMKILAPVLGWLVPIIEMLIAISLAAGLFYPLIKLKALYASVIVLSAFEIYISIMLLSGSHLPCTCGGIISNMGWTEHLYFNGAFIVAGILSFRYLKKHKASEPAGSGDNEYNRLSRA